jgi:two-component SAPR family response regulator
MTATAKQLIISIDDETTILRLVKLVLEPFYTVLTFTDTNAALQTLQTSRPDLIICDINMPGIDGFELHAILRDNDALRSVPFIYLTALADRENFRRGMLQGADDYLFKPFSPDELREAVRTRLGRTQVIRNEKPAEPWSISSLGGAGVFAEGSARDFNENKKVLELFLYLVCNDQQAPQQEAVRQLWQEPVALNSLHRLLSRARKTFEGLAKFEVRDDTVVLTVLKPYLWDAEVFENQAKQALGALTEAGIEKAIDLYGGSFLMSFASPWSETQRGHYEDLYLRLLEASIDAASSDTLRSYAQQRLRDYLDVEE